MQRRSLTLAAMCGALLFIALGFVSIPGASAADVRSERAADAALAWLATQQQSDGGFEVAGFAGFETPDAVLAIADAAQTTTSYSTAAALAAVEGVVRDGHDALDYLDDFVDGGVDAGQAAKVAIVALALGLDPSSFDPQGDGATDLVAIIDAAKQGDGSYGPKSQLNLTIEAMRALAAMGRAIGDDTVAFLIGLQQDGGGWAYNGDDGTNTDADVDTTARAVQALIGAGLAAGDAPIDAALSYLAALRTPQGAWESFGSADPNSTAMALLAIVAAGFDDLTPCFRDRYDPARAGTDFTPSADWLRAQQASDGHFNSPNDSWGVNTFATSQSVQALIQATQPVAIATPEPCPGDTYRVVAANGAWWGYGGKGVDGDVPVLNAPIVATDTMPATDGHWLFAGDGGVFSYGTAPFLGSTGNIALNQPIVGAAATPTGGGYWLFASDGGVFSYGDAPFFGSLGNLRLNQPIVAGAAAPSGLGYLLFAADGGVFVFGDAPFAGSLGGQPLNQPIVAGDVTYSGNGYVLVAADGGVFAFGDAGFHGSLGALTLNAPITGASATPGDGYWLVARDGGVFAFGNAQFLGAPTGTSKVPVVAIDG